LCKAFAVVVLLVLVAVVLGKSWNLEWAEFGFDLPVAAASASPQTRSGTAIDSLLRENLEGAERSRRMQELLPQLPAAQQVEAAHHLVTFATDAAPESVVEPLLNTNTHRWTYGVLMLGLLQRADRIRLPALLEIARNPEHPKSEEAAQYLQFLLEGDDATNSRTWDAKIEARLNGTH
jgi:hypothetical protein